MKQWKWLCISVCTCSCQGGYPRSNVLCEPDWLSLHRWESDYTETDDGDTNNEQWKWMQSVCRHQGERIVSTEIKYNHLKESADVWLVMSTHENHVLKQPEERTVVTLLRLQHGQYAVKLKKEPSSALCRTNRARLTERIIHEHVFMCVEDAETYWDIIFNRTESVTTDTAAKITSIED